MVSDGLSGTAMVPSIKAQPVMIGHAISPGCGNSLFPR